MTMSQPNSGFGETQAGRTGAASAKPDPKSEAVGFAIALAGVNATLTPQEPVTADSIVNDARTIANFLGSSS